MSENILLVDDNPIDLVLLEELLKDKYQIKAVSSAEKALKLLNNESFDLVVTDMCMPQMDGFDLIDKIRKQWPDLPIIMISASLDDDVFRQRINTISVSACHNKPLEVHTFMNTIQDVLGKSQ